MKTLLLATKVVDGKIEGALVIDGRFTRSGSSGSMSDLVSRLLGPMLAVKQAEGTEVNVNVTIEIPKEEVSDAGSPPPA